MIRRLIHLVLLLVFAAQPIAEASASSIIDTAPAPVSASEQLRQAAPAAAQMVPSRAAAGVGARLAAAPRRSAGPLAVQASATPLTIRPATPATGPPAQYTGTRRTLLVGRPARPLEFVAAGGYVPYNNPGTAATGSTTTRQDRTRHRIGAAGFTSMQVAVGNYYVTTSNVETNLGAVTDLQESITLNGVTKRLTFSGATSTTMVAGQAIVLSDPVTPADFGLTADKTPGQMMYVVVRRTVANGSLYVTGAHLGSNTDPAGEPAGSINAILSDDTNNQVMSGAALVTTGATAVPVMPPLAFVGRSLWANKSLLIIGDSIFQGLVDTGTVGMADGSNGGGYLLRAAYSQQVPFANIARFGSQAQHFTSTNWAKRSVLFPYARIAINDYGTNDIAAGSRTSAQIIADNQRIQDAIKPLMLPGARWEHQLMLPRSTSTDAFKTAANQTITTGFTVGGTRDLVVSGMLASVGTHGLDATFDLNQYFEDQANLGKWVTDGVTNFLSSGDGTHFSSNTGSSARAAGYTATRMATWGAM